MMERRSPNPDIIELQTNMKNLIKAVDKLTAKVDAVNDFYITQQSVLDNKGSIMDQITNKIDKLSDIISTVKDVQNKNVTDISLVEQELKTHIKQQEKSVNSMYKRLVIYTTLAVASANILLELIINYAHYLY